MRTGRDDVSVRDRRWRVFACAGGAAVLALCLACAGSDGTGQPVGTPTATPAPTPAECSTSASSVSIDVNAAVTVNTFRPIDVFGTNIVSWANPVPVQEKIQAVGDVLMRFPGGSWADAHQWNGTGVYDADGHWVPSATSYSPGALWAGSKYAADKAVDGDKTTVWRSHHETDFPNAQWLYLDFGAQQAVDKVAIVWGNAADAGFPYARRFTIQYWDPAWGTQWTVRTDASHWLNTTAVDVTGAGGPQEVPFARVTTQYVRILLQQSSAGAGGTYSISEFHASGSGTEMPPCSGCVEASSTDSAPSAPGGIAFDFETFMAMTQAMSPKGVPLVIVNVGTGTPAEAAAWVHYANNVRGYGIKYWEIGNEMNGEWEVGGPLNAVDYARRYVLFYEAMKAADPSITIVGPVTGYADVSAAYDGKGFVQAFVDRLAAVGKAHYAEGISLHEYIGWGQTAAQKLDDLTGHFQDMAASLDRQLAQHPNGGTVPILITEYNSDTGGGAEPTSVRLTNGLWVAIYLGEFIQQFGSRGFTALWAAMNGGDAISSPSGNDLGQLQAEAGPYQYQERATYWTHLMMTRYWSAPGDTRSHRLVQAASSDPMLIPFANVRPDGSLALLVVNKSPTLAYNATIGLAGFAPQGTAQGWRMDETTYQWSTASAPYHASPDSGPASFSLATVSTRFSQCFPPYSLTVLQMTPAAQP
jgi:hypothetical protein